MNSEFADLLPLDPWRFSQRENPVGRDLSQFLHDPGWPFDANPVRHLRIPETEVNPGIIMGRTAPAGEFAQLPEGLTSDGS